MWVYLCKVGGIAPVCVWCRLVGGQVWWQVPIWWWCAGHSHTYHPHPALHQSQRLPSACNQDPGGTV